MNTKKYNWILYFITATILTTIAVQLYWNYKNYEQNKQRIFNEIQISLESAIDEYYIHLSKENLLTIIEPKKPTSVNSLRKTEIWSDLLKEAPTTISSIQITTDKINHYTKTDSVLVKGLFLNSQKQFKNHLPKGKRISRMMQFSKDGKTGIHFHKDTIDRATKIQVFKGKKARDSIKLIKGLTTIFIAIHNDSLAYSTLDSLLTKRLNDKKIDIQFGFKHFKKDSLFYNYNLAKNEAKNILINSSSSYFKDDESLQMLYTNPTSEALKRSSTGILLSLLLSLAVISSLFYLLKIINQQKELAEIKNDLISNITHEFKTPITTVSTALEAISSFNVIDDKEKTKKYLSISSIQLKKLHQMVEKLLETATLDSESLLLKKEEINLVDLIQKITNKHQLIGNKKTISFSSNISEITVNIDTFHFENAISNLIDNAIKYGGNEIQINVNSVLNTIEISVADNGKGIEKHQQEKIFDKFYRIPKGNTHDVKGFGIGLYYTKKIIEKHNGTIVLTTNTNNTVFKITLPN